MVKAGGLRGGDGVGRLAAACPGGAGPSFLVAGASSSQLERTGALVAGSSSQLERAGALVAGERGRRLVAWQQLRRAGQSAV
jgi:hypothetical protein